VSNLTVSDSLIVNSAQPAGNGGGDPVNGAPGILAVEVNGLKVDHVTFQGSEVGIYAGQSSGVQLSYIEGYNMQGPFPSGQLVQLLQSPNSTLTNFYVYNDPNKSHPEDNISVIDSPNTVISHGVIDGNNAVSGVGVMFEGASQGSRAEYIDAIHMMNGAFSSYSNDVTFDHIRSFDNFATDQGRGESLSNSLIFASIADNVHFTNATYTNPGNPGNIAWDEGNDTIQVQEANGATPTAHIQNVFDWTKTGDASAITVSSVNGQPTSPTPATPDPVQPTPTVPEPVQATTPTAPTAPTTPTAPEAPSDGGGSAASGPNITGNSRSNTLTGTSASEGIDGRDGNDTLFGQAGNDRLYGGNGRDTLDGGVGSDHLWGGSGADTFVFKTGYGTDYVEDFRVSGREQDMIRIEKTMFSDFDALIDDARNVNGDVWIDSGSDHLVLIDVRTSQLVENDFLFV
jgi:Ca2+-binding RTX toxin-like protein